MGEKKKRNAERNRLFIFSWNFSFFLLYWSEKFTSVFFAFILFCFHWKAVDAFILTLQVIVLREHSVKKGLKALIKKPNATQKQIRLIHKKKEKKIAYFTEVFFLLSTFFVAMNAAETKYEKWKS